MVGHDAPNAFNDYWFQQWTAADILIRQLQARVQKYAFYNESLAREILRLSEEVRELNRELRKVQGERKQT